MTKRECPKCKGNDIVHGRDGGGPLLWCYCRTCNHVWEPLDDKGKTNDKDRVV